MRSTVFAIFLSAVAAWSQPATFAPTAHSLALPRNCPDTSGSGTAQSCATSPTFTPTAGDEIIYTTTTGNTGALTIAVNGGAAASVMKWGGSATLASGDIAANKPIKMTFDAAGNWDADDIANAPSGGAAFNPFDFTSDTIKETFPGLNTTSGQIGTHGWQATSGSGASILKIAGVAGHPGIIGLSSGGTNGGNQKIVLGDIGGGKNYYPRLDNVTNWEFQWIFQLNTATTSELARVGLTDVNGTVTGTDNALYVEYDPANGRSCSAADWCFIACAGSSCAYYDTGIAAGTGNWVKLRIRSTSSAVALFSIASDTGSGMSSFGAEVTAGTGQSMSKALPTTGLSPWAYVINSTAADRELWLDDFVGRMAGLTK